MMPGTRKRPAQGDDNRLTGACSVVVLYFIFEFVRPYSWPMLHFVSVLKIPMILVIALFIIFFRNEKSLLKDRLVIYVILFILLVGFSVTYARNTYYVWGTFKNLSIFLVVSILVMPVVCGQLAKLTRFINIWVVINVLLAIHALKFSGHGPSGFLWDENDFALALNMGVPYPMYLLMTGKYSKAGRLMLMASLFLLIVGTGMTMSRGGFLGLVAVFGMALLLSGKKMKTIGIVILVVAIAGYPAYMMVPDRYKHEMESISNTKDSTREDRLTFWGYGWEMFKDHPLLGVGAENFPWNITLYQMREPGFDIEHERMFGGRPSHSLYFSLIPELGLAGITIYILIAAEGYRRLRRIMRLGEQYTGLRDAGLLAKAMLVAGVTYLVTGAFISVLYYPEYWYLIAFVLTLDRAVTREHEKILRNEEGNASEGAAHDRNGRARRGGKRPGSDRPRLAPRI